MWDLFIDIFRSVTIEYRWSFMPVSYYSSHKISTDAIVNSTFLFSWAISNHWPSSAPLCFKDKRHCLVYTADWWPILQFPRCRKATRVRSKTSSCSRSPPVEPDIALLLTEHSTPSCQFALAVPSPLSDFIMSELLQFQKTCHKSFYCHFLIAILLSSVHIFSQPYKCTKHAAV